jgi:hypothetical protein
MEARHATSPGKADGTEHQPTPILVPLTLLGAFDLTALVAVAWLALRDDQHRPPPEAGRQKDA